MRFDIYGRYVLDVVRERGAWIVIASLPADVILSRICPFPELFLQKPLLPTSMICFMNLLPQGP
jgi:hypothetical protein